MKKIRAVINNKKIECQKEQTILEVAQENGIEIPALCFHPDLNIKAICRICMVEIKGRKGLFAACATKIEPGMEIITESAKIKKARKINLELIFARHRGDCELFRLAKKYKIEINRFSFRKGDEPVRKFGPAVVFDSSKCIDCRNCVEVCENQGARFLEIKGRGHLLKITPSQKQTRDCVYCGQCIIHCPTGALEAASNLKDVERALKNKNKIVVFQFAPSIRTSIGEEFNMPYGSIVTEQLVAGLKKLGAAKVFDTSVGADFTTVEESGELLEKLENQTGPCLSSCCPAWVKFVEFYYPEFVSNLAAVRSPQAILGGLIKTYWAEKQDIEPKKIIVVSIMPCVAKKYEIQRKELEINGLKPVDYVLTTREIACFFKKRKINLKKILGEKADDPLGIPSGGGVIYGASGGVMESALRTIFDKFAKNKPLRIEFKKARGMEGIKKAAININGRPIKIAVASGLGNAKKILEDLKRNPKLYDAVEIMACPGGCIGGGGQPMPTNGKIREERAKALYRIDAKKEIRLAHHNPAIKKVYRDFLFSKEKIRLICRTKYFAKRREVI